MPCDIGISEVVIVQYGLELMQGVEAGAQELVAHIPEGLQALGTFASLNVQQCFIELGGLM